MLDFYFAKNTINLTRNEWMAAQQHGNNFFIYRGIFIQGVKVFIIDNPSKKCENDEIIITPLSYRMDFDHSSGKFYNVQ